MNDRQKIHKNREEVKRGRGGVDFLAARIYTPGKRSIKQMLHKQIFLKSSAVVNWSINVPELKDLAVELL